MLAYSLTFGHKIISLEFYFLYINMMNGKYEKFVAFYQKVNQARTGLITKSYLSSANIWIILLTNKSIPVQLNSHKFNFFIANPLKIWFDPPLIALAFS